MRTNQNDIAIPHKGSPLPWKSWPKLIPNGIIDANGRFIDTEPDTFQFQAISANFHERFADLVRRMAEPENLSLSELDEIVTDAKTAWEEYQTDLRGGDERRTNSAGRRESVGP